MTTHACLAALLLGFGTTISTLEHTQDSAVSILEMNDHLKSLDLTPPDIDVAKQFVGVLDMKLGQLKTDGFGGFDTVLAMSETRQIIVDKLLAIGEDLEESPADTAEKDGDLDDQTGDPEVDPVVADLATRSSGAESRTTA